MRRSRVTTAKTCFYVVPLVFGTALTCLFEGAYYFPESYNYTWLLALMAWVEAPFLCILQLIHPGHPMPQERETVWFTLYWAAVGPLWGLAAGHVAWRLWSALRRAFRSQPD